MKTMFEYSDESILPSPHHFWIGEGELPVDENSTIVFFTTPQNSSMAVGDVIEFKGVKYRITKRSVDSDGVTFGVSKLEVPSIHS
jgi:hypothetical protein